MEGNSIDLPVIKCKICERTIDIDRSFQLYGRSFQLYGRNFEYLHAKKYVTIFPGSLPFPGSVHICEKCVNKIIKASKKFGLEGEAENEECETL